MGDKQDKQAGQGGSHTNHAKFSSTRVVQQQCKNFNPIHPKKVDTELKVNIKNHVRPLKDNSIYNTISRKEDPALQGYVIGTQTFPAVQWLI